MKEVVGITLICLPFVVVSGLWMTQIGFWKVVGAWAILAMIVACMAGGAMMLGAQ